MALPVLREWSTVPSAVLSDVSRISRKRKLAFVSVLWSTSLSRQRWACFFILHNSIIYNYKKTLRDIFRSFSLSRWTFPVTKDANVQGKCHGGLRVQHPSKAHLGRASAWGRGRKSAISVPSWREADPKTNLTGCSIFIHVHLLSVAGTREEKACLQKGTPELSNSPWQNVGWKIIILHSAPAVWSRTDRVYSHVLH